MKPIFVENNIFFSQQIATEHPDDLPDGKVIMYDFSDGKTYKKIGSASPVAIGAINFSDQSNAETIGNTLSGLDNTNALTVKSLRWAWDKIRTLAWSISEIWTFSKGIALGTNSSPSADGQFWYNSGFKGRVGGSNVDFLTSVSLGNVLFVSADAPTVNDSQSRANGRGREDLPWKTPQNAYNASNVGDIIFVFPGTYATLSTTDVASGKSLNLWLCQGAVITTLNIAQSYTITKIRGFGSITTLVCSSDWSVETTVNIGTIANIGVATISLLNAKNCTIGNIGNVKNCDVENCILGNFTAPAGNVLYNLKIRKSSIGSISGDYGTIDVEDSTMGKIYLTNRNAISTIKLRDVIIKVNADYCIETADCNAISIALYNVILRSNHTNAIRINSSLGITVSFYIKGLLRDAGILMAGSASRTDVLFLDDQPTTTAILDKIIT